MHWCNLPVNALVHNNLHVCIKKSSLAGGLTFPAGSAILEFNWIYIQ